MEEEGGVVEEGAAVAVAVEVEAEAAEKANPKNKNKNNTVVVEVEVEAAKKTTNNMAVAVELSLYGGLSQNPTCFSYWWYRMIAGKHDFARVLCIPTAYQLFLTQQCVFFLYPSPKLFLVFRKKKAVTTDRSTIVCACSRAVRQKKCCELWSPL